MPADRGGLVMRAVKYMSAGVIYPMEVESYITKRYIYIGNGWRIDRRFAFFYIYFVIVIAFYNKNGLFWL